MVAAGNIFNGVCLDPAAEQCTGLSMMAGTRIERIVSSGQTTPDDQWYDQDWTEWVMVLQGNAQIVIAGEAAPRVLRAGDWLEIKPHVRHRVVYTDKANPTVWLAVHCGQV